MASEQNDIELDEKIKEQHRIDSLNLLLYMMLLITTVLTVWMFKHRRMRYMHETGLALVFGEYCSQCVQPFPGGLQTLFMVLRGFWLRPSGSMSVIHRATAVSGPAPQRGGDSVPQWLYRNYGTDFLNSSSVSLPCWVKVDNCADLWPGHQKSFTSTSISGGLRSRPPLGWWTWLSLCAAPPKSSRCRNYVTVCTHRC